MEGVRSMYDRSAGAWSRKGPSLLSDFTARPRVLELCEPIRGSRALDLGCGEGYCTRELARRGAAPVTGIDLSDGMIEIAARKEAEELLGIRYQAGCATDLQCFEDGSLDLVLAVFLFNYLDTARMRSCMTGIARLLRPGGRFVFSVPHPAFPWFRSEGPPFHFEVGEAGYFSGRDRRFPGRIWKRDGTPVAVQLVHKTFEDYFEALRGAGFSSMPTVEELRVTEEMAAVDEPFFEPLLDLPLHVAFRVIR